MLSKVRKAILAGVAAGLAAVAQAITAGGIATVNWPMVVGAGVVAGLATWRIPNAPADAPAGGE